MDKKDFGLIMSDLSDAYLEPRLLEEKALGTWYKFFKDYRREVFEIAVNDYILNNPKRPSIAELNDACKHVKANWKPPIEERNAGLEKYDPDDYEAKDRHPFEDGWRINEDSYWQLFPELKQ